MERTARQASGAIVPYVRRPCFVPESGGGDDGGGADSELYMSYWDPYRVLGLPVVPSDDVAASLLSTQATAEIHQAYRELSKRLHPDTRSSDGRIVEFPWLSLDEQYKAITAAHRLLMDPYLRARYHLWKNINDERVYIIMVRRKRERAMHELEHMRFQYEDVVSEQAARGGLVILRALYGEVMHLKDRDDLCDIEDLGTDVIDVTVPIQIMVQRVHNTKTNRETMKIELSDAPKSLLDGFYDPSIGNNKHLLIRYEYMRKSHKVIVEDCEKLRIPLLQHAIPASTASAACENEGGDRDPKPFRVSMAHRRGKGLSGAFSPRSSIGSGGGQRVSVNAATVLGDVTNTPRDSWPADAASAAVKSPAAPGLQRKHPRASVASAWSHRWEQQPRGGDSIVADMTSPCSSDGSSGGCGGGGSVDVLASLASLVAAMAPRESHASDAPSSLTVAPSASVSLTASASSASAPASLSASALASTSTPWSQSLRVATSPSFASANRPLADTLLHPRDSGADSVPAWMRCATPFANCTDLRRVTGIDWETWDRVMNDAGDDDVDASAALAVSMPVVAQALSEQRRRQRVRLLLSLLLASVYAMLRRRAAAAALASQ